LLIVVVCVLALNLYSCFRPSRVGMDKLPADQQAAIVKFSSDRLRQTLLSAAEEEATVSTIDRGALKEAAAKQKLQVRLSLVHWRERAGFEKVRTGV